MARTLSFPCQSTTFDPASSEHEARFLYPTFIEPDEMTKWSLSIAASLVCLTICLCQLLGQVRTAVAAEKDESADESVAAPKFSADDLAFFEKEVRPLLAERCYECHSADAEDIEGGLRVDSRTHMIEGGDTGPAIVPHNVDKSLLIESIQYGGTYEMPPDSKMPAEEIAILTKWVSLGAPWPIEDVPVAGESSTSSSKPVFSLEERRSSHWCWAPISSPTAPEVKQADWPRDAIDRFVFAAMEAQGYSPTSPAARHSWLRRITYDLTGLPPTLEEIDAFMATTSAATEQKDSDNEAAYESVVDRLLASPRYGEHWARHWMDMVRYGETKAHESDYSIPFVWRYRDYLVRAMNEDVPFDQFVREAIAGDLLTNPRRNPKDDSNESACGPGFFQMTDGHHGPPDIHSEEARVFDGMIDTAGKAFMSLTMTCCRCHDHKFDAVETKDYYAFYGMLASSKLDYPNVVSSKLLAAKRTELLAQQAVVKAQVVGAVRKNISQLSVDALANNKPSQNKLHPLYPLWSLLSAEAPTDREQRWAEMAKLADGPQPEPSVDIGGFSTDTFGQWRTSGTGFTATPRTAGEFVLGRTGERLVRAFVGSAVSAGQLSSRFDGSIKSPMFVVSDRVSLRVKGKAARARLYIQHYDLVGRGPTTAKLDVSINKDEWHWIHFDTTYWAGTNAYVEVLHNGDEMQFTMNTPHNPTHNDGGYVAVDRVLIRGEDPRTPRFNGHYESAWEITGTAPREKDAALAFAKKQLTRLVDRWQRDELSRREGDVLDALLTAGGPLAVTAVDSPGLLEEVKRYRDIWEAIPKPEYVRSLTDGHGKDERVYIRGNPHAQSQEPAPRRFLAAIDPTPFNTKESGRREWAEALVADNNPLVARVIVNRLWQRIFGQGLVATVDNFGVMGSLPSHPELLDYLASEFKRDGWSRKRLLRRLVLSSTYRMGTTPSAAAAERDPGNIYLQRMPVKRLPAEAIRDAILATSGQLRYEMYGVGVPVNTDQAPPSRSLPSKNGPLDGNGRRSVYLEMRRNYLPGLLTAFDLSTAAEPRGLRHVTNVPAQSLAMMNDPFVLQQAAAWAKRVLGEPSSTTEERIDRMHRVAYGREAKTEEIARSRAMLRDLSNAYGVAPNDGMSDVRVWKDFCHLMLNRKEFIFLY